MTNSMKVYKAITEMRDLMQTLDSTVDKAYWPEALKKVGTLLSNAEYNQAQEVAKQALHQATKDPA